MTDWTRRRFLSASATLGAAAGLGLRPSPATAAIRIEHFHHQPWLRDTTFDLNEDLIKAEAEDKILTLVWEQRGCHFCEQMHKVSFQRPDIVELIKESFYVIQMDLWGERRFKDFEGEEMEERELARSLFVRGTPTTVYFDEVGQAVFRMPGYAEPPLFKAVYRYVKEGGYDTASIEEWVKANGMD